MDGTRVVASTFQGMLLLFLPFCTRAEVVINEVLYDPEGPDAGKEFVEIINTGPFAATLEGLTLEAGNGARPDDWDLQWSGASKTAIPPGGLYRIGLDGPGAGEQARLGLQNGPDGVRLCKQGFELDRVGWGELTHPEYFEAAPAPRVRSGRSLARRRDGVDTGDNLADFEEAIPSPGRVNHPRIDWSILLGRPTPEVPRAGEAVVLHLIAENHGREEAIPPAVEVVGCGQTLYVGWSRPALAGGCSEQFVQIDAPPDTGRVIWRAGLLGRDDVPENDSDSIVVRVGAGPVRIVEVLSAPEPNGCEWIELRADAPDGKILNGLALTVRGRRLLLDPRAVDATTRIGLVVEDSVVALQRHPEIDPSVLWSYEGSWNRLRNGGRDGAVSDTIRLQDPDGCVTEVAMPGASPAPGVSLERLEADLPEGPAAWIPCTDPAGATPGRHASVRDVYLGGERLKISPRVVHPGASNCVIEGTVGSVAGEVRLDLLDLRGATVRCLMGETWVAGRLQATWDGRDESGRTVKPGIYVAVLEVGRSGGRIERSRAAVAVTPGEER